MSRSRVFLPAIIMALAATAAGCADHPVAGTQRHGTAGAAVASAVASSKKMTLYDVPRQVLAAAANLGYKPTEIKGRLLFCQKEADTGSIISTYHCVDAASLISELESQREGIDRLERSNTGCYQATCNIP